MANTERRSGTKEVLSTIGIAGGIIAGLLGLLFKEPSLFAAALIAAGSGWYLKGQQGKNE